MKRKKNKNKLTYLDGYEIGSCGTNVLYWKVRLMNQSELLS